MWCALRFSTQLFLHTLCGMHRDCCGCDHTGTCVTCGCYPGRAWWRRTSCSSYRDASRIPVDAYTYTRTNVFCGTYTHTYTQTSALTYTHTGHMRAHTHTHTHTHTYTQKRVRQDPRWCIRHHSSVEKSAGHDKIGFCAGPRFDSGRNLVDSNQHGFENIDPQVRVLNYCFQ